MKRRAGALWPHLAFLGLSALYVLQHWALLADNHHYLSHDNLGYHLPAFVYFAASLAHGFGFPRLVLDWGGSDIAMSAISAGYFSPNFIIGYLVYVLTPASPLLALKLSLLLGVILNAYGWFLLWRRLLPKPGYALFGVFLFFLSGIGITALNQAQILFTLAWLPWTLLFLTLSTESPRWLPLAGACGAGLMTLHYPQIHVVMFCFLGLILGALAAAGFRFPLPRPRPVLAVLAVGFFFMAAAPTLYIFAIKGQYGSPVRVNGEMKSKTLEEYLEVNTQQLSSAPPQYVWNLASPRADQGDDQMGYYVTRAGFALALAGLAGILFYFPQWLFLPFFVAASAWMSCGVFGHLAQLLFEFHFPTINMFRQYYHAFPYVVAGMITLACLGLAALDRLACDLGLSRATRLAGLALLALTAGFDGQAYYQAFLRGYTFDAPQVVPRLSEPDFLSLLSKPGWLREILPEIPDWRTFLAKRPDLAFFNACPAAVGPRAWPLPASGPLPTDIAGWCRLLSSARPADPSVTITPRSVRLSSSGPVRAVLAISPTLIGRAPANATLSAAAGGALTLVSFDGQAEVPFAGGRFESLVILEALAVGLAALQCLAWASEERRAARAKAARWAKVSAGSPLVQALILSGFCALLWDYPLRLGGGRVCAAALPLVCAGAFFAGRNADAALRRRIWAWTVFLTAVNLALGAAFLGLGSGASPAWRWLSLRPALALLSYCLLLAAAWIAKPFPSPSASVKKAQAAGAALLLADFGAWSAGLGTWTALAGLAAAGGCFYFAGGREDSELA